MPKKLINILRGGRISARSEKFLRNELGQNTTKKIIGEAKQQGVVVGVRKETQKRRAYLHFAGIWNDYAEEENQREERERLTRIAERREANERRLRDTVLRYGSAVFRWEDLDTSILDRREYSRLFVTDADKRVPITVILQSRVVGGRPVIREFNFTNYFNLKKWLEIVQNDTVILSDSENAVRMVELGTDAGGYRDIFELFSIVIQRTLGGHRGGKNKGAWLPNSKQVVQRVLKLNNYNVFAIDLKEVNQGDNNCGFRCVKHLLNCDIDIKKWRKQFGTFKSRQLSPRQVCVLYNQLNKGQKKLKIIDENYDDEFSDEYDYIIYKDNHYVAVFGWEYQDLQQKARGKYKGKLAFDIETRETEDIVKIGETDSRLLNAAILSMVFQPLRGKKMKKTFVTDRENNCCQKFLQWLSDEAKNQRYYNGVAHNGSRFDFYLIMSYFNENDIEQSNTQLRGTSIIGMQYKGHQFKDSCCFLTDSLKNLCDGYLVTEEEKKYAKITNVKLGNKTISNTQLCFYKPKLKFWEFMDLEINEPEFWKEYVRYCEYDCESLFLVWEKFKEQVNQIIMEMGKRKGCGKKLIGKVGFNKINTIGSLSKKLIEFVNTDKSLLYAGKNKRMLQLFIRDDEQKYNFVCKFKRGGISHANRMGYHKEGISGFDIKSQYPTAMMEMRIPVGKSRWVEEYIPEAKGFYKLKNMKWLDGWGDKFKPIAQAELGMSLNWKYSVTENYVDSYMVDYLTQHCGLISFEVEKGLVSDFEIKGSQLFGSYVSTLYDLKAQQDEYKKKRPDPITGEMKPDPRYNAAFREACKLLLNSLSGKLVEDPSRYFTLVFGEDGETSTQLNGVNVNKKTNTVAIRKPTKERLALEKKYKTKMNYGAGWKWKNEKSKEDFKREVKELDNEGMEEVGRRSVFNDWVIAGVMVYSFSKRLLWDYVRCLPNQADDVILVETDGLYFGRPLKEEFIKNVEALNDPIVKIGSELGNVEEEIDEEGEGFVLGKKDYFFGAVKRNKDGSIDYKNTKMRSKGVRKNTIHDDGSNKDLLDRDFYKNRYNGQTVSVTWKAIDKTLFATKRNTNFSLAGFNMTREMVPHNLKEFKIYEAAGKFVITKPYEKIE